MNKEIAYLNSPLGTLKIILKDDKLVQIIYCKDFIKNERNNTKSKLLKNILRELQEYFAGQRKTFNIPLKIEGSEFEKDVYESLLDVGYGDVITYKKLAENSGHNKAYRAVGTALKKNKIPIIIPCHRVIKSNGSIGNYMGDYNGGKTIKEKLLKLEDSNFF